MEFSIALYANTKAFRCASQLGFWDFGRVLNRSHNVLLNLSHSEFPQGLYGLVVDCSIPYILHSYSIILSSKDLPLSLWILDGIP